MVPSRATSARASAARTLTKSPPSSRTSGCASTRRSTAVSRSCDGVVGPAWKSDANAIRSGRSDRSSGTANRWRSTSSSVGTGSQRASTAGHRRSVSLRCVSSQKRSQCESLARASLMPRRYGTTVAQMRRNRGCTSRPARTRVSGMHIRTARPDDVDALARLWYDGWQDAHAEILPAELKAVRTLESFGDRLLARLDDVFVALPDGGGARFGFYFLKDDELYQFYVGREARGTGVAAELMTDAEQRFRGRGITSPHLNCAIGN